MSFYLPDFLKPSYYLPTFFNPFNTNESNFTLYPENSWVYYTYFNTGTFTLNLTGKDDILNNTIYIFMAGPGGKGEQGGEQGNNSTQLGKGGSGANTQGKCITSKLSGEQSFLSTTTQYVFDSSLSGTNFNINVTLGELNNDYTAIQIPKVQVTYTDAENRTQIYEKELDTVEIYYIDNFKSFPSPASSAFFRFSDGNMNKYFDINGNICNQHGKFIGGDGGAGAGNRGGDDRSSGFDGSGGGGGAKGSNLLNKAGGGNGINGDNGQKNHGGGFAYRNGGKGGDAFNFLQGGVGGGGGGGGIGVIDISGLNNKKGNSGRGGHGGLGAIMIYYKRNFLVNFIYSFRRNSLITNLTNVPLPIINNNSSFLGVTNSYVISGNIVTMTVTLRYSTLLGSDGFSFNDVYTYYENKNVNIIQFDKIPFSLTSEGHFRNLQNLKITAIDAPKFLPNTSLAYSFSGCTNFNSNISAWDVSNVTNMSYMFQNASVFNSNISAWDVSNVTNMSYMFQNASAFNQNISAWDVSNVTNMSYMFQNASAFNNLNNQMLWNCNNAVIASDFGTGSGLYNSQIYKPAVRFDNQSSIETYNEIPPTRTLLQLFIYSFDNTGLTTFQLSKLPIINDSNSFVMSNVIWNISGNTTTVFINFTYVNINNDDGLSFQTTMVGDYYRNNTITIIQFGNIPLSNNISNTTNKFVFNPTTPYIFQDLSGVNLINNAIDLPIILNPTTDTIGKQIMYREFVNPGANNVNITTSTSYKKIRIYAIGAGGSGGAGGGDKKGEKGTHGAGGGGGGYVYKEIKSLPPSSFFSFSKIIVNVGAGGASVSGGDVSTSDSNDGASGKKGENTYVNVNNSPTLIAYGGSGGGGGHASATATAGVGGIGTTNSGSNSNGINGGNSGYENNSNNFGISNLSYGNGGYGTPGTHDPNKIPTGPGQNGYVRIYFYN
jgi:surface protein